MYSPKVMLFREYVLVIALFPAFHSPFSQTKINKLFKYNLKNVEYMEGSKFTSINSCLGSLLKCRKTELLDFCYSIINNLLDQTLLSICTLMKYIPLDI